MDLDDLYRATAQGRTSEFLDSYPEFVTPEVARELREAFREAVADRPLFAEVAAAAAASVHLRLGNRAEAMTNQLDFLQIEFMKAQQRDEYAWVRDAALESSQRAAEISAPEIAFHARVLAADCAYFAAQAGSDPGNEMFLTALRDTVEIMESLARGEYSPGNDKVWFERLVSMCGAVAGDAMGRYWPKGTDAQVKKLLIRLAPTVDRVIPVDFAFHQAGNPEKTSQYAQVFTDLMDEYG